MKPDFTVIEAKTFHCGQMSRLLRDEHRAATVRLGFDTHRELTARFDESPFRRAWTINGRLAGLGGIVGSAISETGQLWLALSDEARKYPVEVVKESRRQLAEIMQTKRCLLTTVLDSDESAKRFAIFLGFVPWNGGYKSAVSRDGRRSIFASLNDGEARIPVGNGSAVLMNYEAA